MGQTWKKRGQAANRAALAGCVATLHHHNAPLALGMAGERKGAHARLRLLQAVFIIRLAYLRMGVVCGEFGQD